MVIDVGSAERFVLANARLLDRHRLAVLLHGAPVAPVLDALRAYRNPDGGFGHALEPDVRAPESEPAAALHALDVLAEIGALDDPMVADAAAWVATIADPDGGVPFVLPTAAAHPHGPWMVPSDGGSHLTFAIAGALWEAGSDEPWLRRATDWCWAKLDGPDELSAYLVKFSLDFLDNVPDAGAGRCGDRGSARADRPRRLDPRPRRDRERAAHPADAGAEGPARAAARCSPKPRSRPTSTCSSKASRTTAAGRSTGSRGRPVNPSSGAGR